MKRVLLPFMLCVIALRVWSADTPEVLSAKAEGTSVTLKWPRVADAIWTNLYWRTGDDALVSEIKVVNATSPFVHEGLIPGATYRYRLSAAYSDAERDTGLSTSVTLAPAVPSFVDVAGNGLSTTLQWDAVPGAAHYRIYWSTRSGVTASDAALTAPSSPYVHKGLVSGGRYFYRIAAQNAGGEGELSREIAVQLTSDAPVISTITAGDGEATLSWAPVAAVDTYTLYWNTSGDVSRADNKIQFVTSAFIHTALQKGATYFYRLSAINSAGESELSAERALTLAPAEPVVQLQADVDRAVLTWNPVSGADSYDVYWATSPGVSSGSRKVAHVQSPFTPAELKAGETYYYRVAAVNKGGESLSQERAVALRPQVPALSLVEKASRKITLQAPPVVGAQSYNLYWSRGDTDGANEQKIPGVTLPYTHSGLINGATYRYRLAAVNIAGESALSADLVVTLPPDAPAILSINGADKRVDLQWIPAGSNVSYAIYWNTRGKVSLNDTRVTTSAAFWAHEAVNNGTQYFYRIAAVNSGGEGELSPQVSVTLAPDAPNAQVAASGERQMTLSWPEVAGAESYNIYWSSQAGVASRAAKIPRVSSPFVHPFLQKGETYFYRVSAVNEGGETLGPVVPATLRPEIPQAPLSKTGNREMTLNWGAVPGATQYRIYWNSTGKVTVDDPMLEVTQTELRQTNLVNGSTYFYRVAALNSGGSSGLSAELRSTLAPDPPQIRELNGGDHQAVLSWADVKGAVSYNMVWRKGDEAEAAERKIIGVKPPFTHAGIDNGLSYTYRIAAINEGGETYSAPAAVTLLPDVPELTRSAGGDKQAALQWNTVPGATTYTVYWNTAGKVSAQDHPTDSVETGYLHAGLLNGETYYYRLSARNAAGTSALSKEMAVTLAPDAALLERAQGADRSITIQWKPSSGATGYRVYWNSVGQVTTGEAKFAMSEPHLVHANLARGATYYYRIAALNAGGETLGPEFSVTLAPETTMIEGIKGADKQATLVWKPVNGATEYHVYWNSQGNVSARDAMATANTTSLVHPNIKNGLKYFYRVAAANRGGESELSVEGTVTLAPDAPQFEQKVGEDKKITLSWAPVVGAQRYTLYWKPADSSSPLVKIENAISPRVFTGLRNGTKYAFTISASNAGGEGFTAEQIVVTPHNRKLSGLFADAALQQCISSEAAANGWNYADEVAGILVCNGLDIRNLSGAEWLENVSNLSLRNNHIADLSPLRGLAGLTFLALDGNDVVDLGSIASLGALNYLSLNDNPVHDLRVVSELKSLTSLYLNNTKVSDLTPLAKLTRLVYLSVHNGNVVDARALAGLTNLERLHLGGNRIVDVTPLAGLVRLSELDVSRNELGGKGIGNIILLQSLKGLRMLQLGGNNALSCSEVTALINRLGSPPVDLDGLATSFDAPIDGENCVAP